MFMLLMFGLLLQEILANSQYENLTEFKNIPEEPLYSYKTINLPDEHIPYFLHNNQHIAGICKQDSHCPYKVGLTYFFVCLFKCNFGVVYSGSPSGLGMMMNWSPSQWVGFIRNWNCRDGGPEDLGYLCPGTIIVSLRLKLVCRAGDVRCAPCFLPFYCRTNVSRSARQSSGTLSLELGMLCFMWA